MGRRKPRPQSKARGNIEILFVKDKNASDTLYIAGLAALNTANTMPEETLLAFSDQERRQRPPKSPSTVNPLAA